MNFINPPEKSPHHVTHKKFYSELYTHEIGYNVFLPPGYYESKKRYPVEYHLHGWTGDESSELWTMREIYENRQIMTVFPNSSPVIEEFENLPVEAMLMNEMIPHIDSAYKTETARENRSLSGFSMGGGAALVYAIKHPELFSAVTAYAGTYHHYYHKGSRTVGAAPGKAAELYQDMMREERDLEENNILCLLRENAVKIRENLRIHIHVGTEDVLFCDNEILHLHLASLNIPHSYKKIEGAAHELDKIL